MRKVHRLIATPYSLLHLPCPSLSTPFYSLSSQLHVLRARAAVAVVFGNLCAASAHSTAAAAADAIMRNFRTA